MKNTTNRRAANIPAQNFGPTSIERSWNTPENRAETRTAKASANAN